VILDRILEHKKAEIRHKNSRGYLAELKTKIRDAGPTLGFAVTLDARRTPTRPALIAEVKKASPSLGLLRPEFEQRFEPVGHAVDQFAKLFRAWCFHPLVAAPPAVVLPQSLVLLHSVSP
jgi:indole-3-glycerol phosphate synthase